MSGYKDMPFYFSFAKLLGSGVLVCAFYFFSLFFCVVITYARFLCLHLVVQMRAFAL